jgi:hypothetical protein
MSKKKRKTGLSEVKRIDSRCPKPVGVRELMEWVIARDLTLDKWRKQMQSENGEGSVAAWLNQCCVIDPSAVTPIGDGTSIRGIRLRTPADTQPTIEEYLYEQESRSR